MRTCLIVGLLAILVSTGCTTTVAGQPLSSTAESDQPQPPAASQKPGSSAEAGLPRHGAPKVQQPLDVKAFPQNPCTTLTDAQTKELGVPAGVQRDSVTGPACSWENSQTGARVGIQFELSTKLGLSRTYEQRQIYKFFMEIPSIEGYPAVAFGRPGERESGNCSLWVGVSDQLVFLFGVTLSIQKRLDKKDACQAAQIAAGMALKTMKGAS